MSTLNAHTLIFPYTRVRLLHFRNSPVYFAESFLLVPIKSERTGCSICPFFVQDFSLFLRQHQGRPHKVSTKNLHTHTHLHDNNVPGRISLCCVDDLLCAWRVKGIFLCNTGIGLFSFFTGGHDRLDLSSELN